MIGALVLHGRDVALILGGFAAGVLGGIQYATFERPTAPPPAEPDGLELRRPEAPRCVPGPRVDPAVHAFRLHRRVELFDWALEETAK